MFNRDIIQWFLDKQDNNTLKTVLTRLAGVVAMNENSALKTVVDMMI